MYVLSDFQVIDTITDTSTRMTLSMVMPWYFRDIYPIGKHMYFGGKHSAIGVVDTETDEFTEIAISGFASEFQSVGGKVYVNCGWNMLFLTDAALPNYDFPMYIKT